jgi:hypothetical protein
LRAGDFSCSQAFFGSKPFAFFCDIGYFWADIGDFGQNIGQFRQNIDH